jgi:TPP-dependent pyruvate/acetoin dehydrogenase alpha subunit
LIIEAQQRLLIAKEIITEEELKSYVKEVSDEVTETLKKRQEELE